MPIYTGEADVRQLQGIGTMQSSLGEELGAVAGEAFANLPTHQLYDLDELAATRPMVRPDEISGEEAMAISGISPVASADVPIADAREQIKASGLPIKLPEQETIRQATLDIMVRRAREDRERQATIARGSGGIIHGALDVGTSMFVGALDPLNLAAFAIPVVGEARYGKLMADAGSSLFERLPLGLAIGAEKGAAGALALSPLDYVAKSQAGQDIGMAEILRNAMYSAGTMALLHAGFGEGHRLLFGVPQAPAAKPGAAAAPGPMPGTPESIISDLPPRAKEDVLRGAIASIIEDKPVQAAEHIAAAAAQDPRIAESVGNQLRDRLGLTAAEPGAQPGEPGEPGAAPPLRTGRPAVDAVLVQPEVANAIAHPRINDKNDVPYEAGASEGNDPTTNIDHHLPRQVTISGKTFDPAIPANIHEQVEKFAMERLIAKFRALHGREPDTKEMNFIYETAHHEYAEPAEDAWYRANGIDVDEVNKWWAKQDKITEHEHPANPPANLYRKPYPHNEVEGVRHEERGAAAEWPTKVAVAGGGQAEALPGRGPRVAGGPELRAGELPGEPKSPQRAADTAWRELTAAKAAHEETDAIAASKAAEIAPEPASVAEPQPRSLSAAADSGEEDKVVHVAPRASRGPRARPEERWSLLEFLASRGGIDPRDPLIADLRMSIGRDNKFIPGFGNLIRKGGMRLDRAREAAVEAGYLYDIGAISDRQAETNVNTLLEAADRELRGERVYRHGYQPPERPADPAELEKYRDELKASLDEIIETSGVKAEVASKLRPRMLELMERDGLDAADAIDRAIMEEDLHGAEAGEIEPASEKIPGWDEPDDSGSASGSGGAAPPAGNAPGGGDRGGPRARGAGDRDQGPAGANGSNGATALERAAAEAEAEWAAIEPYLSDDERRQFNDVLERLDQETFDREEMIRRGAACLSMASG